MSLPTTASPTWLPTEPLRWDVFCRVIDNHGDLGVCWRLATDLAARGQHVRLWVDDASALAWMAPQGCAGVQVCAWGDAEAGDAVPLAEPGDVVVEAFGCDPPASFVARMAARAEPGGGAPVWINLEYLSAEAYVERSHGLASPQFSGPGRGLTKWFWYPGFTLRTGGLLREPGLLDRLGTVDRDAARAEWLGRLRTSTASNGADRGPGGATSLDAAGDPQVVAASQPARLALLFCYDNPALPVWLDAMAQARQPWGVLVTPGLALQSVERWWRARTAAQAEQAASPGCTTRGVLRLGSLSLLPLAHVDQAQFDRLLRACDLNFVRGEDSFVRAHWAGRPFIWQAYVQHDDAQHAKIAAWLQVYLAGAPPDLSQVVSAGHLAWNRAPGLTAAGATAVAQDLIGRCSQDDDALWLAWTTWAEHRRAALAGQGDLVSQLLDFAAAKRRT